MQDTLGNLFAGVALQFDKPYEIGDWIEIHNSGQKWVGQIYEITWRATLLIGFVEEFITVPNRVMGQSEISNFRRSTTLLFVLRFLNFRLRQTWRARQRDPTYGRAERRRNPKKSRSERTSLRNDGSLGGI